MFYRRHQIGGQDDGRYFRAAWLGWLLLRRLSKNTKNWFSLTVLFSLYWILGKIFWKEQKMDFFDSFEAFSNVTPSVLIFVVPQIEEFRAMYSPVSRIEEIARIVCHGDLRKYYRFRPARFYGGIATADCAGCCLRCLFCWSWENVVRPEKAGFFCSPGEVAERLVNVARKKGFHQMRISGNEPTIAREHLLKVLKLIPRANQFILETNGILIGYEKTYADDLSRFENLYVRVSLKGTNEEEFSALTGAEPMGFGLQIKGLENLVRAGVRVHPAVMVSFSLSRMSLLFEEGFTKSIRYLMTSRLKNLFSTVTRRSIAEGKDKVL